MPSKQIRSIALRPAASPQPPRKSARHSDPLNALGAVAARIRKLRVTKGLTLKSVAEASSLSPSMLSQIERGGALPSIGSLFAIANALGVPVSQLIVDDDNDESNLIVRCEEQRLVKMPNSVTRILRDDKLRGVSISLNEYKPRSGARSKSVTHVGFEYGVILEGMLTIEIAGDTHILKEGDVISFDSKRFHKIYNHGDAVARTLWVNVKKD